MSRSGHTRAVAEDDTPSQERQRISWIYYEYVAGSEGRGGSLGSAPAAVECSFAHIWGISLRGLSSPSTALPQTPTSPGPEQNTALSIHSVLPLLSRGGYSGCWRSIQRQAFLLHTSQVAPTQYGTRWMPHSSWYISTSSTTEDSAPSPMQYFKTRSQTWWMLSRLEVTLMLLMLRLQNVSALYLP